MFFAWRLRFLPVVLDVSLRGLSSVMRRVVRVAMSEVGVVCGLLVVTGFVVFGGFLVMPSSVLVMFGGLVMVFGCLIGHEDLLVREATPAGMKSR